MKKRIPLVSSSVFLCLNILLSAAFGQEATPTPTTQDDSIRIPTEEVHLTVRADGPYAGVALKLRTDDFTIFEDGVAQSVTSIRTLPAQVLILVDTGASLTFAKSRGVATLATQLVINNLPEGSSCSVMQYNERVETRVPWTSNTRDAIAMISGGLNTGRRSMLGHGLASAVESFVARPGENRHLVLVTDGLDGSRAMDLESKEVRALESANVVVHVLSYTAMERDGAKEAAKRVKFNWRPSRPQPRVPEEIFNDMVRSLPISIEQKQFLKTMNEATQIVVIDLDSERRKMLKTRRGEWEAGEASMREIAARTGGSIAVPLDESELLTQAGDIGRSIGLHFDVTYMPTRPLSEMPAGARRAISISSKSDALKLRTRQNVVTRK